MGFLLSSCFCVYSCRYLLLSCTIPSVSIMGLLCAWTLCVDMLHYVGSYCVLTDNCTLYIVLIP